jgi:general secretion pathway protein C
MLGTLPTLPANMQRALTILPKLLSFLLVILIAVTAAKLVWGLYKGNTDSSLNNPIPAQPVQAKLVAPPPPRPDYGSQIARLRLMGKPEKAVTSALVQSQAQDAPDTSLNLTLTGVIALGDGEGFAIISDQAKKNKYYQIDDEVVSGVTLTAVFPEYVLLNRSGRDEKLRLPRSDTADFTSVDARPTSNSNLVKTSNTVAQKIKPSANQDNTAIPTLSSVREELKNNPRALKDYLLISAANDPESGEFQGYKINPNKNTSDFFYELGFSDNDIVISVNDISLQDPNNAAQALKELKTAKQLSMTVLRDGNEITLLHNL